MLQNFRRVGLEREKCWRAYPTCIIIRWRCVPPSVCKNRRKSGENIPAFFSLCAQLAKTATEGIDQNIRNIFLPSFLSLPASPPSSAFFKEQKSRVTEFKWRSFGRLNWIVMPPPSAPSFRACFAPPTNGPMQSEIANTSHNNKLASGRKNVFFFGYLFGFFGHHRKPPTNHN